jgi:hypothetical protein
MRVRIPSPALSNHAYLFPALTFVVVDTGVDTGMDIGMDIGIDTGMDTGADTGRLPGGHSLSEQGPEYLFWTVLQVTLSLPLV